MAAERGGCAEGVRFEAFCALGEWRSCVEGLRELVAGRVVVCFIGVLVQGW